MKKKTYLGNSFLKKRDFKGFQKTFNCEKVFTSAFELLFVLAIFLYSPVYATPFRIPSLPEREIKESKAYLHGKAFNPENASQMMRLQYYESPNYLKATIQWVGNAEAKQLKFTMVENLNSGAIATNVFYFVRDFLVIEKYERTIVNKAGRTIRTEIYNLAHPHLKYPNDLMHPYTLEVAFRGIKLNKPGSSQTFNLWLPPNVIIPVEARVMGTESITVTSQTRQCYRVDLFPQFTFFIGSFLAKIIQPLMPQYSFWFEVNGTHPIVRYRGPLGKINSSGAPTEIYDLVRLDPDPSRR